ncbi:hypothetical protein ACFS7Z_17350 [Pontibacter toksunensis]|uniref:STAS/SEC14 domain-containing protein n=1 Tax=Pontibacter toksunensis TaxID=1332631 RepID=A0ABW6BXN6_9BACT
MPVDLPRFSEGYMAALQFAASRDARFWLHDIRLRNTSCVNQRSWFTNTFVPAANSTLSGSVCIAYLMSPLQREGLVQKSVSALAPVRYSDLMTVQYFTNEHDALEWLTECRSQVLA